MRYVLAKWTWSIQLGGFVESRYQIVPYTFHVHVSGMPNELKPLNDFDAGGTSVLDFIAGAAGVYRQRRRYPDPTSTSSIEIVHVKHSPRVVLVTAKAGSRGMRGDLEHEVNGTPTVTSITPADSVNLPLRHVFFVPPGSRKGVLLVERVGTSGSFTNLRHLLEYEMTALPGDLRLDFQPAMSEEAMTKWAEDALIKRIVLQQVHRVTGEPAAVKGLPVGKIFEVRAPRRRGWRFTQFGKVSEIDQKEILTEVLPSLPMGASVSDVAKAADQMLEEGWTVSLDAVRGGKRRRMAVKTKMGITLTFPAGPPGVDDPTDEQFLAACRDALAELSDLDEVRGATPELCTLPEAEWHDEGSGRRGDWGVESGRSAGTS